MALYRCAACGSPNVVTDTQAGGISYNYAKGALGTVVLGVGGAAAGIQSSTQQVFKCPDCGMVLSYPMPQAIKETIDLGVLNPDARDKSPLGLDWDFLKSKYKNIESGIGDEILEMRRAHPTSLHMKIALEVRKAVKNLDSEIALEETLMETIEEDQAVWEATMPAMIAKRTAELEKEEKAIEEATAKEIKKTNTHYAAIEKEISDKIASVEGEKQQVEQQLATLGFFKFSEKNQLKEKIEKLTAKVAELKKELGKVPHQLDAALKKIQQEKATDLQVSRECVYKEYSVTESPKERHARVIALKELREKADNAISEWEQRQARGAFYLPLILRAYGSPITTKDTVIKFGWVDHVYKELMPGETYTFHSFLTWMRLAGRLTKQWKDEKDSIYYFSYCVQVD